MLNQITKDTEIKTHSSKNVTTFTIDVGLHPEDIVRILDILSEELLQRCDRTKKSINAINEEIDYVMNTLNVRNE